MKRKIYLASSWRNIDQPLACALLREAGHEVYDFRNPEQGNEGFHWSEISPDWLAWTIGEFSRALGHPIAESGFALDWNAMQWADTGVLLLPCGRSAHLEAGYFVGAEKRLIIMLSQEKFEPELMYKMADAVCCNFKEVLSALEV